MALTDKLIKNSVSIVHQDYVFHLVSGGVILNKEKRCH